MKSLEKKDRKKSEFCTNNSKSLSKTKNILTKTEINRIKVALAETRRKNKWLAEQLGKDESTISQWCSNARQPQPSLENLHKIAITLEIDIRELLNPTKTNND